MHTGPLPQPGVLNPAVSLSHETSMLSGNETGGLQVIVFNDHPVFRSALGWKLGEDSGIEVVADAPSLHETLQLAGEIAPDVVVADLRIGDGNSEGVQSVTALTEQLGEVPVIVYTDHYSSSFAARMTGAGAAAVVQKSSGAKRVIAAVLEAVPDPAQPAARPGRRAADAA